MHSSTAFFHRLAQRSQLRGRRELLLGAAFLLGLIILAVVKVNSLASGQPGIAGFQRQKAVLSPNEFQFTGQGQILAGSGQTWVVGGIPIQIESETEAEGAIHPGDQVSVVGHITANGSWVAERVDSISEEGAYFSFAGPLESAAEDAWQVAGVRLAVDENSLVGDSIPLGELVLATFQVQPDNSWLALQIQALADLEKARTPTITPTSTPAPSPTLAPASSQGSPSTQYNAGDDDHGKKNEDKDRGGNQNKDHDDEQGEDED